MLSWLSSFIYEEIPLAPEYENNIILPSKTTFQPEEILQKKLKSVIRSLKPDNTPHLIFILDTSNTMKDYTQEVSTLTNKFLLDFKEVHPNIITSIWTSDINLKLINSSNTVSYFYPFNNYKISSNESKLFDNLGFILDMYSYLNNAMFVILTSGVDNCSCSYTLDSITQKIIKTNNEFLFPLCELQKPKLVLPIKNKEKLNVVFLLDTSKNMRFATEMVLNTVNTFLFDFKHSDPNVHIFTFDSSLTHKVIESSINSVYPYQKYEVSYDLGSNLFDSIGYVLDLFDTGNNIFIVLTSGIDSLSHKYNLETITEKINNSKNEFLFPINPLLSN